MEPSAKSMALTMYGQARWVGRLACSRHHQLVEYAGPLDILEDQTTIALTMRTLYTDHF